MIPEHFVVFAKGKLAKDVSRDDNSNEYQRGEERISAFLIIKWRVRIPHNSSLLLKNCLPHQSDVIWMGRPYSYTLSRLANGTGTYPVKEMANNPTGLFRSRDESTSDEKIKPSSNALNRSEYSFNLRGLVHRAVIQGKKTLPDTYVAVSTLVIVCENGMWVDEAHGPRKMHPKWFGMHRVHEDMNKRRTSGCEMVDGRFKKNCELKSEILLVCHVSSK